MWKVTSVTSERSSRWTASQTEASSPGGCCCGADSGTGNRQPSWRLICSVKVENGRERNSSASSEVGSLTPASQGREKARGTQFGGGRKSREKPPRAFCDRFGSGREGVPILSVSHEAHLPAEEAQASPDPRVPRADAYACRARDAEAAARQGPQAAHAVAMDGAGERGGRRRSRRQRLSRSAEFDRVYREGRSHANRYLVVYSFPREGDEEDPRLGVSVGRKVGGAVERNRVKRLLRDAFWAVADGLPEGHDFVVVAGPESGELAAREGEAGVERELRELLEKAGLARSEAA